MLTTKLISQLLNCLGNQHVTRSGSSYFVSSLVDKALGTKPERQTDGSVG